MSKLAVQKVHSDEMQSHPVLEQLRALTDRIRQRAYEIFQGRAGADGSDLDDWLKAENDLLIIPGSDLIETDSRYELEIALPGFDAKDVEITALPDALIVRAKNIQEQHQQNEGNVQLSGFAEKCLFRCFELPTPIDVDNVSANLDRGLLKLTAPKVQQGSPKFAAIAA